MKFNLIENDESTAVDELILAIIIVVCIAAGVLLIVFRPCFWIFEQSATIIVGILFLLFGVMFVPSLIYRLVTNKRK